MNMQASEPQPTRDESLHRVRAPGEHAIARRLGTCECEPVSEPVVLTLAS